MPHIKAKMPLSLMRTRKHFVQLTDNYSWLLCVMPYESALLFGEDFAEYFKHMHGAHSRTQPHMSMTIQCSHMFRRVSVYRSFVALRGSLSVFARGTHRMGRNLKHNDVMGKLYSDIFKATVYYEAGDIWSSETTTFSRLFKKMTRLTRDVV